MRKKMKSLTEILLTTTLCLGLTSGLALAEEDGPTTDLSVSMLSKYVWRGFELSRDSLVVQPSMTVGYKGFSANMWSNLDTSYYYADNTSTGSELSETDLTLAYDGSTGIVSYGAGYIYYGLDGIQDTQELYATVAIDVLLSPSMTIYRDIDNLPGWYVTLGVSHSFALNDDLSLDLGGEIGYLSADDKGSYSDTNGGSYSEFHNGLLSASMSYAFARYFTVTPELYYSFPLNNEAKEQIKGYSTMSDDTEFIYGGVTVGMSF